MSSTIFISGAPDRVLVRGDYTEDMPYAHEGGREFAGRVISSTGHSLLVVVDRNGNGTYNYLLSTSPEDEAPEEWKVLWLGDKGLQIVSPSRLVVVSLKNQII